MGEVMKTPPKIPELPRSTPHKLDDDGHAVARFIERHYPDNAKPTTKEATEILDVIRATSVHVEDVPDEGQEIWRGRGAFHPVKMVVRDGVVTTVLPRDAERPKHRGRPG